MARAVGRLKKPRNAGWRALDMEPRAHHLLVGLFTLIVAVAAVVFSLWMTKAGRDSAVKEYQVVFTEPISGLSRGSAVQYNGIKVGEVTLMELDPDNIGRVLVHINVRETLPVSASTRARLAVTSITGAAVIELYGSDPSAPPLTASNDELPTIMATPSSLTQLMSSGEDLMTNITQLITNANNFLSSDNADKISSSLAQLETLLEQLAHSSEGLPQLIASLDDTSAEIHQTMATVRQLVGDQGAGILERADEAMRNIEETTNTVKSLVESNADAIAEGSTGFALLEPTMQSLRQAIENINFLTERINENPAEFLLGKDNIQEFRP